MIRIKQVGLLVNARCSSCNDSFDGLGWLLELGVKNIILCDSCKLGLENLMKISAKDNREHYYLANIKQIY